MGAPARKAIIVGLDGASMELVRLMAQRGHMPNVKRLLAQGVHREMLGVTPTLTPPGWTTLYTGAWPGTHGILDFNIRATGRPLGDTVWGIDTGLCRAEYLWNTAERCGKVPVLVKQEMSWPPTITRGIQVEGTGPGVSNHHQIAGYHLFATPGFQGHAVGGPEDSEAVDPSTLRSGDRVDWIELSPARDWRNLPESQLPPLQAELVLRPLARGQPHMQRGRVGIPKSYYLLTLACQGTGYDRVLVCTQRDAEARLASLRIGQWSEAWSETFVIDGQPATGSVRCKLMHLDPTGDGLQVFFPQIWPLEGYTVPPGIASEINEHVGPFLQNPARDALGLIDDDTYFELLEYHHQCLARVSSHLTGRHPWDLLITETHASDYANHFFLRFADPISGAAPEIVERCYGGLTRTYESIDRMVGQLAQLMDEDTVFCIVSDHGGTPQVHPQVSVEAALAEAGLLVYSDQGVGGQTIDWRKTRAAPVGVCHVFINLAGREPGGIVAPEDYGRVQREVVDAILDYREPDRGQRAFNLALTRNDAEMLNLWGDHVGDVVYAIRPEFDGAHGYHLPCSRLGIGAQHATFILAGAGVRKGKHLQGQVRQVDVAPTVCYLLGIDVPRDAEGGVVYEALEEPSWHLRST